MAPTRKTRLSSADAAYIAGLIDGEGTVTLSREHRGERRRLVVSIANTDLSLLRFVKDTAGIGRITSKRTVAAHHTASYAYRVTSRQALALLEQVAPFLRTYRRARADLALADYLRLTPRNGKYSSSIAKERQEFETTSLAIVQSGTPPEPDGCSFGWNLTMRLEESSPHYAVRDRSRVARPFI